MWKREFSPALFPVRLAKGCSCRKMIHEIDNTTKRPRDRYNCVGWIASKCARDAIERSLQEFIEPFAPFALFVLAPALDFHAIERKIE